MAKSEAQLLTGTDRALDWAREVVVVVGASLFVALCARVSVPLPFTPVPLTLSNFAVLLVGLTLGRSRGFAALALYLAEGASGLPVFSPTGPGGIVQLLGPSGGFLMAYPFVAGLAGWIAERGRAGLAQVSFARFAVASLLGEILLFAAGISWLFVLTHSFEQALRFGLYWFVFAEVIKVLLAAGAASGWRKIRQ
jgi:biotin transport system substrate-specific component